MQRNLAKKTNCKHGWQPVDLLAHLLCDHLLQTVAVGTDAMFRFLTGLIQSRADLRTGLLPLTPSWNTHTRTHTLAWSGIQAGYSCNMDVIKMCNCFFQHVHT